MPDRKQHQLPALDPKSAPVSASVPGDSSYPEPLHSRMGERERRSLGDACGLGKLGVNLVVLEPNAQSSLRHWHTLEDEFVYVLEGEITLATDSGEQLLGAGMCAGFPAGERDAHHLINRSDRSARYLEIGCRMEGDDCFYPDDDMLWVTTEVGWHAAHKNGEAYEP